MAMRTPEVATQLLNIPLLKSIQQDKYSGNNNKKTVQKYISPTLAPHALSLARKFERIYGLQEASPLGAGDFFRKVTLMNESLSVLEPGNLERH